LGLCDGTLLSFLQGAAVFSAGEIPDPDDAAEEDLFQSLLREL